MFLIIDRYDKVPNALVVNNTLQIVYADGNAAASHVGYDTIPTLTDTEFVPVQKAEMAPADIEYRLDVFFDVGSFISPRPEPDHKSRPMMMARTALLVSPHPLLTEDY